MRESNVTKQLWYLTLKNFKSMIREKSQLIWIFGYPLVFILLLRFGYGLEVYKIFAPGIVILAPIVLISQLAGHFAEEKESGTLQRLITTPVSRSTILLSGLLSQLIVAAIQIVVMLILVFLSGATFNSNTNIFLLFFIPFLVAFTSLGFGLLLASIVKTASSAGGLAWFIILPLQFLGGLATVPLVPFIPTSLGAEALGAVMIYGSIAFDPVGFNLILIAIWGVGLILLGILLFRRKTAIL
ncbi:MAG: ABC transporter permease [Promethearchaeota archaeon]|jgi:ABC-2 type transport system permease protein